MLIKDKSIMLGDIYLWFANIMHRPDVSLLTKDYIALLKDINESCGAEIDDDLVLLKNLLSSDEADPERLIMEHSRLFMGPFTLPAPPYESHYRNNGNFVETASMNILSFIKKAGLEIADDYKDAPDHIVMELNFLSELCYAKHLSLSNKDNELVDNAHGNILFFLSNHLLPWISDFRKTVEKNANLDFYPVVVRMLEKILINHFYFLSAS